MRLAPPNRQSGRFCRILTVHYMAEPLKLPPPPAFIANSGRQKRGSLPAILPFVLRLTSSLFSRRPAAMPFLPVMMPLNSMQMRPTYGAVMLCSPLSENMHRRKPTADSIRIVCLFCPMYCGSMLLSPFRLCGRLTFFRSQLFVYRHSIPFSSCLLQFI